ncbi:MAG: sulfurtransferase [Caulobacter vibrioides]|uniref:Sulfurtransferase n=1 Tax=Caulobacter vibrioides TaxID=155892 RepID=A0A258D804_CAUVI|nr:MAG: sulfurtransferase [Caulobacter vibrioides]
MTLDRAVLAFAGFVVLIGLALAHFVHPYWVGLSAFAVKKLGVKPGTAFR